MTGTSPYGNLTREQLLLRLAALNVVLERHRVAPLFTVADAEASELPLDNLRAMVAAVADRLPAVARALDGLV
jgi:hypothetical protein